VDPLDMTPPRRYKPLVVAVQGLTKRVGHELFLAADVRVAASDTIFAQDDGEAAAFPTLRPELARLMTTQDFGEAVRALTEQRTPTYHGR
jgi:1,4-dihydroxy-2-naphthoyl-CoA synthase